MRPFLILLALFLSLAPTFAEKVFLPFSKFPPVRDEEWAYGQPIASLKEKSLFDYPADVDVYRFIDCSSECFVARIVKRGSQAIFTGIETGGSGDYNIAGIAVMRTKVLSHKEWMDFNSLLEKSNFWEMNRSFEKGADGYSFILEARVGGKYHFVARWVPHEYSESKKFARLGDWILALIPSVNSVKTTGGYGLVTDKGFAVTMGTK